LQKRTKKNKEALDLNLHWFGAWEEKEETEDVCCLIREELWEAPGQIYTARVIDVDDDDDDEEGEEGEDE